MGGTAAGVILDTTGVFLWIGFGVYLTGSLSSTLGVPLEEGDWKDSVLWLVGVWLGLPVLAMGRDRMAGSGGWTADVSCEWGRVY